METTDRAKHVPPGEGESVWLVGDLIEVKLASEDTAVRIQWWKRQVLPKADRHRTYTTTWTKRCMSRKGK